MHAQFFSAGLHPTKTLCRTHCAHSVHYHTVDTVAAPAAVSNIAAAAAAAAAAAGVGVSCIIVCLHSRPLLAPSVPSGG
jgi:hypothetical protein